MAVTFSPLKDVTLGQLPSILAEQLPQHLALRSPQGEWTFAEFERDTNRVAAGLWAWGIRPGQRVAVWSTNRAEWLMLQFGLAKIGAILVTVNTALRHEELAYLLRQSGSVAIFLEAGFRGVNYLEELSLIRDQLPELKTVCLLGQDPLLGYRGVHFQELLNQGELTPPSISVSLDDCINMQYTSGTTGFPKGVRLSSRNIVNNGFALGQGLGYSPEDRLCLSVPLFHCFGCVIGVLASFTHGVGICLVPHFEPGEVLQTVHQNRCTAVYGVPTMFVALLEHEEFQDFDLSTLRTGVMAGSLCPEPLMRQVIDRMNLREMTIAYGLTETSPAVTMTPRHDPISLRTQTVGVALAGVEIRVSELGELQVRGQNVMIGYHDDPQATARAIDEQGWFSTGDQASIDEKGYVRITGRLKDIIIRGGENIGPKEVEDVLRQHPQVLDVAVYGIPCPKFGEAVAAAVRWKGGQFDALGLEQFCRQHLAAFKVPRHYRQLEEFPLTASGKIQKFRLRESHVAWSQETEGDSDGLAQ